MQTQDDRPIGADELIEKVDRFKEKRKIYQRASDRVANLAFTVVTASTAIYIFAPAVKSLVAYFPR